MGSYDSPFCFTGPLFGEYNVFVALSHWASDMQCFLWSKSLDEGIVNCPVQLDTILLNSSPPSAAYRRQWIGSALVHIMACRLFGAKPLSKPMLGYCQLDPIEQTSVKF